MVDGADTGFATSLVKVACLLMIGVMVISGIGSSMAGEAGLTLISMTTNPSDGETLTLGGTTLMVFEFNSTGTVTEGNWPVEINITSAAGTLSNLYTSVDTNTGYILTSIDDTSFSLSGTNANAITDAANLTVTAPTATMGSELYSNVTDSITSGYALAALMVLALGAAGIMRYLGYM